MAGQTFLTEVGIVDEFAPPPNSGVKLRVPAFGEKTLIFPEVKPRTYRPTNDAAMFGYPRYTGGASSGKKVSQYSFRHLRSRNLLAHNPMHDEELWHQNQHLAPPDSSRRRGKKELTVHRVPPIEDRQADETSAASGVTSMTATTASRLSAVESHSMVSSSSFTNTSVPSSATARTPVPSMIASSRVSRGSAYEGLVSVSQVGAGSATSRSTLRSSAATTEIARLEGELKQERVNRESTQKRLSALQEKQELLLQRLRAAGMDAE